MLPNLTHHEILIEWATAFLLTEASTDLRVLLEEKHKDTDNAPPDTMPEFSQIKPNVSIYLRDDPKLKT